MYIKFDGIEGDSQDELNQGWIEIDHVNFGFAMPTTGERSARGAATTGKVDASSVSIAKSMDTASLDLVKRIWTGAHIPKVEIKLYRAAESGRVCYTRIELADVVISGVGLSGMDGSGLPGESYTLNYGSILIEYTPTDKAKGGAQPKPLRAKLNRIENTIG